MSGEPPAKTAPLRDPRRGGSAPGKCLCEPIFQDEELVAFDKPAGLLTIPGRDAAAPALWRLAETELGARLWAVHRLDRETSGLVVFAKNALSHARLSQAFEAREVEKVYLARVSPAPPAEAGELLHELVPARRGHMRVAREGEQGVIAETGYRVLRSWGDEADGEALVELRPRTGRTHQLRLQLASIGSPIVGDDHYRSIEPPRPAKPSERLWLHAWRLRVGTLALEAPVPEGLIRSSS